MRPSGALRQMRPCTQVPFLTLWRTAEPGLSSLQRLDQQKARCGRDGMVASAFVPDRMRNYTQIVILCI